MAEINLPESRLIVTRERAIELGLKKYFTGAPCKRGHIAERDTKGSDCRACSNRRVLEFGRAKAARKKLEKVGIAPVRHEPTGLCVKRSDAKRLNENRYFTHKLCCAGHASPRTTSGGNCLECRPLWLAANEDPEDMRIRVRNRRAKRRSAGGSVSLIEFKRLLKKQKFKCAWCGTSIKKGAQMDHVKPLSKGGEHSASNVVGSCSTCNQRKAAKDPIQWARELGKLI